MQTITTASGDVLANGLIATITIDTIGWFDNSPGNATEPRWELKVADTLNGDSDFAGKAIDITNGWILFVPEPGSFALLLMGGLSLVRRG